MPAKPIRAGKATAQPTRRRQSVIRSILTSLDRSLPDYSGEQLSKPILTTIDRIELHRGLISGEYVAINRNLLRAIIASLEAK